MELWNGLPEFVRLLIVAAGVLGGGLWALMVLTASLRFTVAIGMAVFFAWVGYQHWGGLLPTLGGLLFGLMAAGGLHLTVEQEKVRKAQQQDA